jgi:4-nitrophenyl phosphatase
MIMIPDSIKGLILDMDGVLWRGDSPIGDLSRLFEKINYRNFKTVLLTNNSTKSPDQYQSKLQTFGVCLDKKQIITSSQAVVFLLAQRFPHGGPVFMIGEDGLENALKERNFFHSEQGTLAVVSGLDRSLDYTKLKTAALLIRAGIPFYGTNPDKTFPTPNGLVPGAGAILTLLETSTNIHPIIAGKPFPYMFQLAIQQIGESPTNIISIGDRLETDILGGKNMGCKTGLVLSGVTSYEDLERSDIHPDFVAESLSDLIGS